MSHTDTRENSPLLVRILKLVNVRVYYHDDYSLQSLDITGSESNRTNADSSVARNTYHIKWQKPAVSLKETIWRYRRARQRNLLFLCHWLWYLSIVYFIPGSHCSMVPWSKQIHVSCHVPIMRNHRIRVFPIIVRLGLNGHYDADNLFIFLLCMTTVVCHWTSDRKRHCAGPLLS